ncbi:MAG: flagellar biosynthetic protein FlhB [Candidatus Tokpelaia sp. JSC189]|nr:MAG: flagellar biosynthetic protein FlhB [Candidatus Tokpelaia sp. JSC189]
MSEEKPDKESQTEEPTEHKIRKAEEKGDLPFSRELPIFASLVGFSSITVFIAIPVFTKLSDALVQLFERPEDWQLSNAEDIKNLIFVIGGITGLALAPVLAAIMAIGAGASIIQNTPRLIGERIRPKFLRISPKNGFNRIFSKSGFVEFLKSVIKLIGVTLTIYLIFFHNNTVFVDALAINPSALPEFIRSQLAELLLANVIAVIAIASFDIAWSRINWRRQLRMTKQEIKEELKQIEGNPMVKARMRSLSRDRSRRQMIASVPKASLVIVNPNHFSVALRYKPPMDTVPVVIAKGQNILALKIREIAHKHKIPVIENMILARALYRQTKLGQMIAPEFYQTVAELIRYINTYEYQRP